MADARYTALVLAATRGGARDPLAQKGGVSHKAMAGIELALWDIKAKSLGVPVYELFGGPMRDRMRLYWSHCGTTRARMGQFLGTPPLKTYDDIAALGREVVTRGFTALKTNMVIPGDPATVYFPGFASGINTTDGAKSISDSRDIRRTALMGKIPYYTTIPGATAAVEGIIAYRDGNLTVRPLQDYFAA